MSDPDPRPEKSRGKPIIGFALGLVAGTAIGFGISGTSLFQGSGDSLRKTPADSAAAVTFEDGKKSGAQSGDALGALLETGATGYQEYDRTRKVMEFVDGLTPGDLAGQIDAVFARRNGNRGYDLINSLYQKWVEQDHEAALRHAEGLEGKDRKTALNAVLSAWATKEPYEVLAWMEEHGNSTETQSAAYAALTAIAQKNPEEAIELAENGKMFRGTGTSFSLNGNVAVIPGIDSSFLYAIWAENDPQAAMARAMAIPNSLERTNALQGLAMQWAYKDPQAAWEWGNGLERARERDAVLQNVVSAVVGDGDTSQAIAFLEGMAPGQARRNALQQIVMSMATSDPESAYEFARSRIESGGDQQVYSSILSQWARTDPGRAFEVALNELDPGNARNSAIQSIISGVANRDVALAREMLRQLDDELMRGSVYTVASSLARNDVDSALAWAGELPDGDARKNAYSSILSEWAQEDPEKALTYGLGIEDEDLRRQSLQNVLSRWGYEDAVEAMTWAVENLEAKEQESLIPGSLLGTWLNQDVAGASEWVAALPDGDLRTQCVANLVSNWSRQDLVAAGQWLKKVKPGDGRDEAVERYASQVFETDPEAALIWAESIGKEEDRSSQVENLARRYLQKDQAKAKRWIANSSLPPEKQAELLKAADQR